MAKKLLLADDSLTIQKVVGISFANEDIQIITVDNGDDALVKVREVHPDVVLADVVMPGKNGYEVCAAIKGDPALRHIPVLLLTGTFEAFDEERARRARADGHITKPFEAQALVDEVNRLLARAARAQAPAPAPAPASARASAAPELRATQPTPPPSAAPAATSEDAFDFFDEDLAGPAAAASAPAAAAPAAAAPAAPAPPPATTAFELDAGESAFDFAPVVDEPPARTPTPSEAPTVVASSVTPHSDRTLALGPEGTTEEDWPSGEDLDAAFDEEGLGSLDLELEAPRRGQIESPAEKPTVLAFDAPAAETSAAEFDFGFDSRRPAAPARDPLADFDAPDAAREALLDPDAADAFAVSSSDLGASFGRAPGASRPPRRAPDAAPTPAPLPTPEPEFGPEVDFAQEPEFSPRPDLDDEEGDAIELTAEPTPARPAVAAEPAPTSGGPLTPAMRERVHDSLEKIAWEAFADLPDTLVRQAVAKIEEIAWEVIPQMAEALIREEIRKLKGEG
jgi:CheY-like chemotaxis protein